MKLASKSKKLSTLFQMIIESILIRFFSTLLKNIHRKEPLEPLLDLLFSATFSSAKIFGNRKNDLGLRSFLCNSIKAFMPLSFRVVAACLTCAISYDFTITHFFFQKHNQNAFHCKCWHLKMSIFEYFFVCRLSISCFQL